MTATIDSYSARDEKVNARAQELLATDFTLQELAKIDKAAAWRRAVQRAAAEIQFPSSFPAKKEGLSRAASREEAVNTRAEELIATNSQLVQLARTDRSEAFKRAIRKAAEEIPAGSGGSGTSTSSASTPITLTRQRRVHEVATWMLKAYPDLIALAGKNYPEALKRAHAAAENDHLVGEHVGTPTLKLTGREEKVYRLALTMLMQQSDLKALNPSEPGKAFDQAMAEAVIHYPVNADGTEGEPTRFARAAEMDWITSSPNRDRLRDERARTAIYRQRSDAELQVLDPRLAALETDSRRTAVRDVPALQPGEPYMVTLTRGPDGRSRWSIPGRRASSPAGLTRT